MNVRFCTVAGDIDIRSDRSDLPEEPFERLIELPPSAKLVYKVLEYNGTLTQGEIRERSRLPQRTTRYALTQLYDADLIVERTDTRDARRTLYTYVPVDPDADGSGVDAERYGRS